jgi:hypothetical protein
MVPYFLKTCIVLIKNIRIFYKEVYKVGNVSIRRVKFVFAFSTFFCDVNFGRRHGSRSDVLTLTVKVVEIRFWNEFTPAGKEEGDFP